MRKLASIQKVLFVEPIDGADKIEKIGVLGWQLVARRGEFKSGDLCVYFEIDSLLPYNKTFSFLWSSPPSEGESQTFRLRSKRLKGVISQGLALPLSCLPESIETKEGTDVTDALGVSKWDPSASSNLREIEAAFPSNLFPKTDEVRLQSVPEILDELRDVECYAAVKVDGQSLTFAKYLDGDEEVHRVCSRNFCLRDLPGSPHWDMARKLDIFNKLPMNFAVQGEFAGEGIQSNRLGIKGREFFAFQIFDIAAKKYLSMADFRKFCASRGINTVPIEWVRALDMSLKTALQAAEGKYTGGHPREGIVIRPTTERVSSVISQYSGIPNSRASFKIINNDFLLKIRE